MNGTNRFTHPVAQHVAEATHLLDPLVNIVVDYAFARPPDAPARFHIPQGERGWPAEERRRCIPALIQMAQTEVENCPHFYCATGHLALQLGIVVGSDEDTNSLFLSFDPKHIPSGDDFEPGPDGRVVLAFNMTGELFDLFPAYSGPGVGRMLQVADELSHQGP